MQIKNQIWKIIVAEIFKVIFNIYERLQTSVSSTLTFTEKTFFRNSTPMQSNEKKYLKQN